MRRILAVLALAAMAMACARELTTPNVAPVVAAERAFAADAGERGWVEAFETWSAQDAVLLEATPVNARQSLAGIDPANRGDTSLAWAPEFAGVSAGGDFGFTSGPYNGDGAAFGQYFTVWRKQTDGAWRWIYDGGTNTRTPTTVNPEADVAVLPIGARGSGSAEAAIASVRTREEALAAAASENAGRAYRRVFAAAGRMNREDEPTAVGANAAAALAGDAGVIFAPPQIVEASGDGSLVFVLGEARWQGGSGYFCRIWALQPEGWRIGYDQIVLRSLAAAPASPPQPGN